MTFLSIKQVAERLGKDKATIWRWVNKGKLVPTMRAGGRCFFSEEYIAAYEHSNGVREREEKAA